MGGPVVLPVRHQRPRSRNDCDGGGGGIFILTGDPILVAHSEPELIDLSGGQTFQVQPGSSFGLSGVDGDTMRLGDQEVTEAFTPITASLDPLP